MGCDIHVVVERKCPDGRWRVVNPKPEKRDKGDFRWGWGVFQDELTAMEQLALSVTPEEVQEPPRVGYWYFGRNYEAFAQLAGVRATRDDASVFPIKGFPKDAADLTFWEFHMRIVRETSESDNYYCATLADAEKWRAPVFEHNGQQVIAHPDWHSPNWLTGKELASYSRLLEHPDDWVDRIQHLTDALKQVAEEWRVELEEVRTVFWFDN